MARGIMGYWIRNHKLLLISVQQQAAGGGKCSKFHLIFVRNFSDYTFFLVHTKQEKILT